MRYLVLILSVLVLLPGCGGERRESPGNQKLSVFVSIIPLAFFVETIAGGLADIEVLVGPGQPPETFEPTGKQMARLENADAFFSVGVPFEEILLSRIENIYPSVQVFNTCAGITLKEFDPSSHQHERDPHVWLNPRHAKTIARNILDALVHLDPGNEAEYARRYKILAVELDGLDAEIAERLAPVEGMTIMVYHPAYGYFADRYGLKQVAIEEGGVAPGSKHVAQLIESAGTKTVRAIFVQPQFSSAAARTMADRMGIEVYTVDPLSEDYVTNLRELANTIIEVHAGQ